MHYLLYFALLSFIAALFWLCNGLVISARNAESRLMESQLRWMEVLRDKDRQYIALTESYLRAEGKTFIPPPIGSAAGTGPSTQPLSRAFVMHPSQPPKAGK